MGAEPDHTRARPKDHGVSDGTAEVLMKSYGPVT